MSTDREKRVERLKKVAGEASWMLRKNHADEFATALDQAVVALSDQEKEPASEPGEAVARKQFPVLNSGGQQVDWQLVADHGKQAQANHYQTVERLAERGGLAWSELYAVLHNKPWQKMDENEAIIACRALEAHYLAATHPAPSPSAGGEVKALREALAGLISYVERNECEHEETHRGGFIWTICDQCGRKWADDEGGFKAYEPPVELTRARAALASPAPAPAARLYTEKELAEHVAIAVQQGMQRAARAPVPAEAVVAPVPDAVGWSRRVDEWMGNADVHMSQASYRKLQALVAEAAASNMPMGDGYVLVPREPTQAMLVAGNDMYHRREVPLNIYRAMIAASTGEPGR